MTIVLSDEISPQHLRLNGVFLEEMNQRTSFTRWISTHPVRAALLAVVLTGCTALGLYWWQVRNPYDATMDWYVLIPKYGLGMPSPNEQLLKDLHRKTQAAGYSGITSAKGTGFVLEREQLSGNNDAKVALLKICETDIKQTMQDMHDGKILVLTKNPEHVIVADIVQGYVRLCHRDGSAVVDAKGVPLQIALEGHSNRSIWIVEPQNNQIRFVSAGAKPECYVGFIEALGGQLEFQMEDVYPSFAIIPRRAQVNCLITRKQVGGDVEVRQGQGFVTISHLLPGILTSPGSTFSIQLIDDPTHRLFLDFDNFASEEAAKKIEAFRKTAQEKPR